MIFIYFCMRNLPSETFFVRHETIFFICASGGRFVKRKLVVFVFSHFIYIFALGLEHCSK